MPHCFRIVILFAVSIVSLPARAQGRIECNALTSLILKNTVHYCVYLPASYDAGATKNPPQHYPVLYFLHGLGDNEKTLFNTGSWTMLEDLRDPAKVKLEGRAKRLKPVNPQLQRFRHLVLVACCFVVLIAAFAGLVFLSKR